MKFSHLGKVVKWHWVISPMSESLVTQTVKKEYAGNVGDPGLIPELGRSPGEGMATHSNILAWRTPQTEESDWLQPKGS